MTPEPTPVDGMATLPRDEKPSDVIVTTESRTDATTSLSWGVVEPAATAMAAGAPVVVVAAGLDGASGPVTRGCGPARREDSGKDRGDHDRGRAVRPGAARPRRSDGPARRAGRLGWWCRRPDRRLGWLSGRRGQWLGVKPSSTWNIGNSVVSTSPGVVSGPSNGPTLRTT